MFEKPSQKQYKFDTQHLEWLLRPFHGEAASMRAEHVVEDMERLGIEPCLQAIEPNAEDVIAYYTFGQSKFELSKDGPDTLRAVGFGLGWGNIFDLSDACEIGRRLFGKEWPTRFRKSLIVFDKHVDTIEELLWLGLAVKPHSIQREVAVGRTRKRVDWRFISCDQVINLEVKLRPKDWKRVVDGPWYSTFHASIFDEIAPKFADKTHEVLNLVGITLLAPLDREAEDGAGRFLQNHPNIDGVIYWSTGMRDKPAVQFHLKPNARHVKLMFEVPTKNRRFTFILHPWRDREKRRAERLGLDVDLGTLDGIQQKVGNIIIPRFDRD